MNYVSVNFSLNGHFSHAFFIKEDDLEEFIEQRLNGPKFNYRNYLHNPYGPTMLVDYYYEGIQVFYYLEGVPLDEYDWKKEKQKYIFNNEFNLFLEE